MPVLVYSSIHPKAQIYAERAMRINNIYTPCIECIVKRLFNKEIEMAKRRVEIRNGRYRYTPSNEYYKYAKNKTINYVHYY